MGACVRADAGASGVRRIDGNREAGPEGVAMTSRLQLQTQTVAIAARKREAYKPAPLGRHEADSLGSGVLGEHRQIPLVLAVGIVDQDDHAPPFQILYRLGY